MILGRNQGLHAEQHRRGIGAGFFTETVDQRFFQAVAQGSDKPCIGEKVRLGNGQFLVAVDAEGDPTAKQGFTEIVAVRVVGSFRVIQGRLKGYGSAGDQAPGFRRFLLILIKGPVGAAGYGPVVQRDRRQSYAHLTEIAFTDLSGDDAGDPVITLRRQRGMKGEVAGKGSERDGEHHTGGETQAAFQQQDCRERGEGSCN